MSRPSVSPLVLSELTGSVPQRVAKKLDASPRAADAWSWSEEGGKTRVDTGAEIVELASGSLQKLEGASCTCLLAPRCFHLLAVLSVLPLADAADAADVTGAAGTPAATDARGAPAACTPEERSVARDALRVSAALVTEGLSRVSTVRLGEILRVIHAARKQGLPRLESAAIAVLSSVRSLRDRSPDFRLEAASDALGELLLVSMKLSQDERAAPWIGVGRRAYRPARALRLAGIACEAVVSRGYAGVVTYFTDGARVYSSHEVSPGEDERAVHAYDAPLRFGEVSLSHRDACRSGLLFATATLSDDGRLGAGKDVIAAASPRDASMLNAFYIESLGSQLARADEGAPGPGEPRRQGLLFIEGEMGHGVIHVERGAGAGALRLSLPIDHPRFAFRENLELLASVRARVRLVGRLSADEARIAPIAVYLSSRLVNLAFDRLARADLPPPSEAPPKSLQAAERVPPLLEPLRRRLLRFALAGRSSLPGAALPEIAREGELLRRSLLGTGASALEALATASSGAPLEVARAWLGLLLYVRAAGRSLARTSWGRDAWEVPPRS